MIELKEQPREKRMKGYVSEEWSEALWLGSRSARKSFCEGPTTTQCGGMLSMGASE